MTKDVNNKGMIEEKAIIKFLERTKNGEFTEIKPITLEYRVLEERENNIDEESYLCTYA